MRLAGELQIPLVGELDTSGAELARRRRRAARVGPRSPGSSCTVSGVVPTLLAVTGACVSGPALALGLFDHVVMTDDAFAYVTGPDSVERLHRRARVARPSSAARRCTRRRTRRRVARRRRRGRGARRARRAALRTCPTTTSTIRRGSRPTTSATGRATCAAAAVPERSTASYDVRVVIDDVLDDDSFLELRPQYAPNLVTGLRLARRPRGRHRRQPADAARRARSTSRRRARRPASSQWCDAFNLPIITFVDTPGFEPGRDLEWRGMIRHGAELVHAYAAATVPRLCVVLRKAYGGAYIVMDSRGIGNDLCVAWPSARDRGDGRAGRGRRSCTASGSHAIRRALDASASCREYETRSRTRTARPSAASSTR